MNLKKLTKSKKGFTLVELIVVIVIIAILAAALVTSLVGYINKARETTALVEANNVYVAAQAYISENVGQKATIMKVTNSPAATANGAQVADTAGFLSQEAVAAVNVYLGSTVVSNTSGVSNQGYVSSVTINAEGTITAFKYTATNGNKVKFATATGWEKDAT